jgi:hypothetical protein
MIVMKIAGFLQIKKNGEKLELIDFKEGSLENLGVFFEKVVRENLMEIE